MESEASPGGRRGIIGVTSPASRRGAEHLFLTLMNGFHLMTGVELGAALGFDKATRMLESRRPSPS